MDAPIKSNQTRGFRLINTFAVTQDNQQITVDLPRGPHIEAAIVRISGTINVGVAFAGGARVNGSTYMLRRGDWVLNSNVTLDSVSGPQLFQLHVTRRAFPTGLNAGAGAGAQTFDNTFIFDRAIMDMMRPKDSMLKTDVGVSNNQLRLQLGQLADMFLPGAGSATYTSVTCTVSVIDYQEARGSDGNTPSPLWYAKRNGLRQALPAAGNGQQIKLNTGNRLRIVSMRVLDGVTAEPNLALMTRVRIQRAGDTRCDMLVAEQRKLNESVYGVLPFQGQVIIDFANTGPLGCRYSEFWPIPSSADTYLLVDTTASSIIELATLEGVDL